MTYELEVEHEGKGYVIQFEITDWGSAPHMGSLTYAGDPGDPIEWEVIGVFEQPEEGAEAEQVSPEKAEAIESACNNELEAYISTLTPPDPDMDWL